MGARLPRCRTSLNKLLCEGFELDMEHNNMSANRSDCPKCGQPCDHTTAEKQGFAMDALEEAGRLYAEGKL